MVVVKANAGPRLQDRGCFCFPIYKEKEMCLFGFTVCKGRNLPASQAKRDLFILQRKDEKN